MFVRTMMLTIPEENRRELDTQRKRNKFVGARLIRHQPVCLLYARCRYDVAYENVMVIPYLRRVSPSRSSLCLPPMPRALCREKEFIKRLRCYSAAPSSARMLLARVVAGSGEMFRQRRLPIFQMSRYSPPDVAEMARRFEEVSAHKQAGARVFMTPPTIRPCAQCS